MSQDKYRKRYPITIKSLLKRAYIRISPLSYKSSKFEQNYIHFLYGHHLYNDEVENFHKVIEEIGKENTFISYSDAIDVLNKGDIDGRYCCLSFDDGFHNNLLLAELLHKKGISAMFFINPWSIENAGNKDLITSFCAKKLNQPYTRFLSWTEVNEIINMGHEIGNHGYDHSRLNSKENQFLRSQIIESRVKIEKKLNRSINHFAWPYGKFTDISVEALDLIRSAGYTSVASAIRGLYTSPIKTEREVIHRDQIIFNDPAFFYRFFRNKSLRK